MKKNLRKVAEVIGEVVGAILGKYTTSAAEKVQEEYYREL